VVALVLVFVSDQKQFCWYFELHARLIQHIHTYPMDYTQTHYRLPFALSPSICAPFVLLMK